MESKSVQCNLLEAPPLSCLSQPADCENELEFSDSEKEDPDYEPDDELDSDEEQDKDDIDAKMSVAENTQNSVFEENKFIVFQSSLIELLQWCHCPKCGCHDVNSQQFATSGSQLSITLNCLSCGSLTTWYSQPFIKQVPAGNLLMSAAVLFAGASSTKALRVFCHMNVAAVSARTFHRHQRCYLHPAVRSVWRDQQSSLLAVVRGSPVVLGGDGRADSMGHSAKFGSYALMDLQRNKVLDVQLVQVTLGLSCCLLSDLCSGLFEVSQVFNN